LHVLTSFPPTLFSYTVNVFFSSLSQRFLAVDVFLRVFCVPGLFFCQLFSFDYHFPLAPPLHPLSFRASPRKIHLPPRARPDSYSPPLILYCCKTSTFFPSPPFSLVNYLADPLGMFPFFPDSPQRGYFFLGIFSFVTLLFTLVPPSTGNPLIFFLGPRPLEPEVFHAVWFLRHVGVFLEGSFRRLRFFYQSAFSSPID